MLRLDHLGELKSFLESGEQLVVFLEDDTVESRAVEAILDRLEKKNEGVKFGRINIAAYRALHERLGIETFPTVWMIRAPKHETLVVSGSQGGAYSSGFRSFFIEPAQPVDDEFDPVDLVSRCCNLEDYQLGKLIEENLAILILPREGTEQREEVLKSLKERCGPEIPWKVVKLEEEIELRSALARHEPSAYGSKKPIVILDGKAYPAEDCPAITEAEKSAYAAKAIARLDERIRQLQSMSDFVLFMKGTKQEPYCKFSKAVVAVLNEAKIDFAYFDIFEDDAIRERTKQLVNWPTYPQLYYKGQLIGGLDIIKAEVEAAGGIEKLRDHLKAY